MPTIPPLVITDEERAEPKRRVRAHTTPQRPPNALGSCCWPPRAPQSPDRPHAAGMNQHTVAQWRRRFEAEEPGRPARPQAVGPPAGL